MATLPLPEPPKLAGDPNRGTVKEAAALPLSLDGQAQLAKDQTFMGRVKMSALGYSSFIMLEDKTTPAYNTRRAWAQRCQQMPDTIAQEITPIVVKDPVIVEKGETATDAQVQSATEAAVNSRF